MAGGRRLGGARRRSGREWAKLVREWKRSGLSATEFAAPREISPRSLAWWRWRLSRPMPIEQRGARTPRLVRVDIEPSSGAVAPAAPGWEIATTRGRLLVHGSLGEKELIAVLRALVGAARP